MQRIPVKYDRVLSNWFFAKLTLKDFIEVTAESMSNNPLSFLSTAIESSSGTIIFSLDRNYCYTSFTQSHKSIMKKIWGVEIAVGDNLLGFLDVADRIRAKANFDRALAGEHFTIVEEFGDKKLFRSFWEDRYDPIEDAEGRIIGLVVLVSDISSHARTTQKLEETQTRLRLALSASKTGVWEWLIEENEVYWSEEIYELFGTTREADTLNFTSYQNYIHPEDKEHVLSVIKNTLENKGEYLVQHRIVLPNNQIRWIKASGVLFMNVFGNPEKLLGIVQDITDQHVIEEEKRNWQIRYDMIVKSSGQMIYDYDTTSGKIDWFGNTQDVLGFTNEEMGDINRWSNSIHPDDQDKILEELNRAQQSMSKFEVTYRFKDKSGNYKILSDRGFFMNDSVKQGTRMLGIMEDITHEKESEQNLILKNEELTKTNRELDRFVYSASHDLRAPIASILGLIKVARLEKSMEVMDELLMMQERSLLKLDAFIRDIVDHSRNARMGLHVVNVTLKSQIEDTFDNFTFLDNLKHMKRVIEVTQYAPFFSDDKRIQIILNNLISNSIKYADISKPNSFINIHATIDDKKAVLTIEDNGEGIRSESKDQIFNMFYRASENSSGSGLGLYIVKEVLEKLHGTIEVESEFGVGTKFRIEIPNQFKQIL
jgi:PAS domain S-box-containing protein